MIQFESDDSESLPPTPPPDTTFMRDIARTLVEQDLIAGNMYEDLIERNIYEGIPAENDSYEDKSNCNDESLLVCSESGAILEEGEVDSDESFNSNDARTILNYKDMKASRDKHERDIDRRSKSTYKASAYKYSELAKSNKPELQYVYKYVYHPKCRKKHRRVDFCSAAAPHVRCGRGHSYAMQCNGEWMSLRKFEAVAMKWPSTKVEEERLQEELFQNRSKYEKKSEKSVIEMTDTEKMMDTCLDWNKGMCRKCKYGEKKRHQCSMMVRGKGGENRICWGNHKEVDHDQICASKKRQQAGGEVTAPFGW